jgi:hypothetical protein
MKLGPYQAMGRRLLLLEHHRLWSYGSRSAMAWLDYAMRPRLSPVTTLASVTTSFSVLIQSGTVLKRKVVGDSLHPKEAWTVKLTIPRISTEHRHHLSTRQPTAQ